MNRTSCFNTCDCESCCSLHGVPTVGPRRDTTSGPWGGVAAAPRPERYVRHGARLWYVR